MNLTPVVITILIVILLGVLPLWPYSRTWGFKPSGAVAALIILVLLLFMVGRP